MVTSQEKSCCTFGGLNFVAKSVTCLRMANNLRKIRNYRGLTQPKLGEMVGTSKANISRHEKKRSIQTEMAAKYAKALRCTIDELTADDLDLAMLRPSSEMREIPGISEKAARSYIPPPRSSATENVSFLEIADLIENILLKRGKELSRPKYAALVNHIWEWNNLKIAEGNKPSNDDIIFEVATYLEKINKGLTN